jgi:hypothetical protein
MSEKEQPQGGTSWDAATVDSSVVERLNEYEQGFREERAEAKAKRESKAEIEEQVEVNNVTDPSRVYTPQERPQYEQPEAVAEVAEPTPATCRRLMKRSAEPHGCKNSAASSAHRSNTKPSPSNRATVWAKSNSSYPGERAGANKKARICGLFLGVALDCAIQQPRKRHS